MLTAAGSHGGDPHPRRPTTPPHTHRHTHAREEISSCSLLTANKANVQAALPSSCVPRPPTYDCLKRTPTQKNRKRRKEKRRMTRGGDKTRFYGATCCTQCTHNRRHAPWVWQPEGTWVAAAAGRASATTRPTSDCGPTRPCVPSCPVGPL